MMCSWVIIIYVDEADLINITVSSCGHVTLAELGMVCTCTSAETTWRSDGEFLLVLFILLMLPLMKTLLLLIIIGRLVFWISSTCINMVMSMSKVRRHILRNESMISSIVLLIDVVVVVVVFLATLAGWWTLNISQVVTMHVYENTLRVLRGRGRKSPILLFNKLLLAVDCRITHVLV